MPPLGRRRKSKFKAPAVVIFSSAKNERGHSQLCVYAECTYGGTRVGPVWSHNVQAINRALATLSSHCDCGRRYHTQRYVEGYPIRRLPRRR